MSKAGSIKACDMRALSHEKLAVLAAEMFVVLEHIERATKPGIDQSDDDLEAFIANVRDLAESALNNSGQRR